MNSIEYHIYWKPSIPVSFDEDTKLYKVSFKGSDLPLKQKGGIYQIYGHHPVYGQDSLLYIGITDSFDRRFSQHFEKERGKFYYHVNLSVSVGIVHTFNDDEIMKPEVALLERIEGLLVFAHQPAINTKGKQSPPQEAKNLLVFNRDWRRGLFPEVSGRNYVGGG